MSALTPLYAVDAFGEENEAFEQEVIKAIKTHPYGKYLARRKRFIYFTKQVMLSATFLEFDCNCEASNLRSIGCRGRITRHSMQIDWTHFYPRGRSPLDEGVACSPAFMPHQFPSPVGHIENKIDEVVVVSVVKRAVHFEPKSLLRNQASLLDVAEVERDFDPT
ncbi:unnamed protein product [Hydatigera taeniaeformis]|uniref:FLYWCH-type domain-containing protein n=1 Tax=Hydatigena taeniaeformis TaxID=6205 RepID=A0A0R3X995_HYDTA|nr:unnamed protein product [Hydatigera taeniaeformis]